MVHLVYCDNSGKSGERVLDKILRGEKTMIVRGAAGRKIPHSRVFEGETLYFIEKGSSLITAMAEVIGVENYVKLSEEEINETLSKNQTKLQLTEKQFARWCSLWKITFSSNTLWCSCLFVTHQLLSHLSTRTLISPEG